MAKVIIYLKEHELSALHDLAQREYRTHKAQAALIIRRELERLGMIRSEIESDLFGVGKTSVSNTGGVS